MSLGSIKRAKVQFAGHEVIDQSFCRWYSTYTWGARTEVEFICISGNPTGRYQSWRSRNSWYVLHWIMPRWDVTSNNRFGTSIRIVHFKGLVPRRWRNSFKPHIRPKLDHCQLLHALVRPEQWLEFFGPFTAALSNGSQIQVHFFREASLSGRFFLNTKQFSNSRECQ